MRLHSGRNSTSEAQRPCAKSRLTRLPEKLDVTGAAGLAALKMQESVYSEAHKRCSQHEQSAAFGLERDERPAKTKDEIRIRKKTRCDVHGRMLDIADESVKAWKNSHQCLRRQTFRTCLINAVTEDVGYFLAVRLVDYSHIGSKSRRTVEVVRLL